jgi:hypothetical protein
VKREMRAAADHWSIKKGNTARIQHVCIQRAIVQVYKSPVPWLLVSPHSQFIMRGEVCVGLASVLSYVFLSIFNCRSIDLMNFRLQQ